MRNYWKSNLACLEARFPNAAAIVKSAKDVTVRDGPRLRYTENGQTHHFPFVYEKQKVQQAAATIVQDKHSLIVFSGCGAGYIPREIAKILPDQSHLLIQERHPQILKGMLTWFNCQELLKHPRIDLAVGQVPLAPFVQGHLMRHGHNIQIAQDDQQWAVFPEYPHSINTELMPYLQDFTVNHNTLTQFGGLFTENCLKQIPSYLTGLGVEILAQQYEGFPAVIVGGGPSLEKNVEVLRGFKGKGVLIAADTVLGYLLERGIAPDFVVSVDPQARTFEKYQNLSIPEEVALVFHPGNHHAISTTWPREKYHTGTGMLPYAWMDPFLGKRLAIDDNIHCQVHMGCNLALHFGCRPIALAGMDLAYTNSHFHAPGSSYLNAEEEMAHVSSGLDFVDIWGHSVKTSPIFLNYRHILEAKAKANPNRFVYATEGGIGVPGMPNHTLAHVLHGGGEGRYIRVAQRRRWCHHMAMPIQQDLLLHDGWRRAYELRSALYIAKKALEWVNQEALDPIPQSQRLHRLMMALRQHVGGLQLLQLSTAQGEQTYMHEVADHIDRVMEPAERYRKQCDRAKLWLTPIVEQGPKVLPWIEEALSGIGPPVPPSTIKRWKKGWIV